jgi:hypothetical protein
VQESDRTCYGGIKGHGYRNPKWNESGGEESRRPDFEDWIVLDGNTYCPECSAKEALNWLKRG